MAALVLKGFKGSVHVSPLVSDRMSTVRLLEMKR